MAEPDADQCQQCGSKLSAADPHGLCPQCLVQFGLDLVLDGRDQPTEEPALSPLPGVTVFGRIGDYDLIEEIGRGGMGVVYRAHQISLKRTVAVKMILSGEFASRAAVRRFRAEAEAAAGLRHPNIVGIHEIGEFNGKPFFSMDLVQGKSLAALGRDGRMDPVLAARYTRAVALAVKYAHAHGILHRDLKPSNVLVDTNDQPQLTDFGLAKRMLEESDLTLSGQLLGSPNFMPPEQASRRRGTVGVHSDIYAIGAILYYLLTGRPPFFAGTVGDTLHELLYRDPLPPRLLNASVPLDLQTLCLKCLEKEPAHRYGSAQDLADDLQRFLDGRPIFARPVSRTESAWKWCRRKPVLATLSLVTLALLLGVAIGSPVALSRIRRERDKATQLLYVSDVNLAFHALRENDLRLVRDLLERHRPKPGGVDLRGWEWGHLWHESESDELCTLSAHADAVNGLAFSPVGTWLATGSADHTVRVWDSGARTVVAVLPHPGPLHGLAFLPDGTQLLTVSRRESDGGSILHYWQAQRWQQHRSMALDFAVEGLSIDSAGKFLALTDNFGKVTLYDFSTLTLLASPASGRLPWKQSTPAVFASGHPVLAVALPDAITLFPGDYLGEPQTIPCASFSLFRLAMTLAPDGRYLAIGGSSPAILDSVTLSPVAPDTLLGPDVRSFAFSRGGDLLAVGHGDRTITLYHTKDWSHWVTLKGHGHAPSTLAFSADGRWLASLDGTPDVKLWNTTSRPVPRPTSTPNDAILSSEYSLGQALLHLLPDRWIEIHSGFPDGKLIRKRLPEEAHEPVHLSPDGNRIAATDATGGVLLFYDVTTMQLLLRFPAEGISFYPYRLFSRDGTLFTGYEPATKSRVVWRVADGREMARLTLDDTLFHQWWLRDSRTIVVAHPAGAYVWDTQQNINRGFLAEPGGIHGAVQSRDGSLLATVGPESVVRVWDARTLRLLRSFAKGEPVAGAHTVAPFDFSPDNRRLVVIAGRTELTLYDLQTGQEVGRPVIPGVAPVGCGFSEDGKWIVAAIPRFGFNQATFVALQAVFRDTPAP